MSANKAPLSGDDELVKHLGNAAYKAGYLEATLEIVRGDISRAMNMMVKGTARGLLEERLAEIDRVLGLVKRASDQ